MSLSQTVADAVDTAFNAVGDIAKSITYTQKASGTYSPATGLMGGTDTAYTIQKAILTSYAANQIDGTVVQAGDQKLLIKAAELSITPSLGDTVTIDSSVWQVVSWMKDPTNSLWTFQVRQ